MRNEYLSKVKNEYQSKKVNAAQSRSQFENYRNHLACLPKKSLLKVQKSMNKHLKVVDQDDIMQKLKKKLSTMT